MPRAEKRQKGFCMLVSLVLLLSFSLFPAQAEGDTGDSRVKLTYEEAGSFNWTVPEDLGVNRITVRAWGAGGGGGAGGIRWGGSVFTTAGRAGGDGGGGGFAQTTLTVTSGETLRIVVGAGGTGGGLSLQNLRPSGGGGGGYSGVLRGQTALLVAPGGGGGGAGGSSEDPDGGGYGGAGGSTGFSGGSVTQASGGGGGTDLQGGAGGVSSYYHPWDEDRDRDGKDGSSLGGGHGGYAPSSRSRTHTPGGVPGGGAGGGPANDNIPGGGGGGSGWWGGGGGAAPDGIYSAGGGGGGSVHTAGIHSFTLNGSGRNPGNMQGQDYVVQAGTGGEGGTGSTASTTATPGTDGSPGLVVITYDIPDYSGFSVSEPGGQVSGVQFDLSITNARGKPGSLLNGNFVVEVTSNREQEGRVYYDFATFSNGTASIPVALDAAERHTLTISVEGITDKITREVLVYSARNTADVILSDLTHDYDGTAKSATVTTVPAGLNVVFTYDGGSTPPVNPGTYQLEATVVDDNYEGSASGIFTIHGENGEESEITAGEEPLTQEDGLTIYLGDRPLQTDVEPVIIQGRTMVPLRGIFEALEIEVEYNAKTRTITGTKGETRIQLAVDSTETTVNGKKVDLDVPATVIEGRTMVPVRFVAESTGQKVDWDPVQRRVTIEPQAGVDLELKEPALEEEDETEETFDGEQDEPGQDYTVTGQVVTTSNRPVENMKVRVYHMKLRGYSLLGESMTDAGGDYAVHYELPDLEAPEAAYSSLAVYVLDEDDLLVGASDLVFNPLPHVVVNITVVFQDLTLMVYSSEDFTPAVDWQGVIIESDTGHRGMTPYTLLDLPRGTQVHLKAPEYVGSGASKKWFSHWSGTVESEERELSFTLETYSVLTAQYADSGNEETEKIIIPGLDPVIPEFRF